MPSASTIFRNSPVAISQIPSRNVPLTSRAPGFSICGNSSLARMIGPAISLGKNAIKNWKSQNEWMRSRLRMMSTV